MILSSSAAGGFTSSSRSHCRTRPVIARKPPRSPIATSSHSASAACTSSCIPSCQFESLAARCCSSAMASITLDCTAGSLVKTQLPIQFRRRLTTAPVPLSLHQHSRMLLPLQAANNGSSAGGSGTGASRNGKGRTSGNSTSTASGVSVREKPAQSWGRAPVSSSAASSSSSSSITSTSNSKGGLLATLFASSSAPKGVTIKTSKSQNSRKTGNSSGGSANGGPDGDEDDSEGWQWFNWQLYNQGWDVPWGPGTTVLGLGLWILSFVLVGFLVVPGGYRLAGVDFTKLSADGRATFTLVTQVVETAATLAIVRGLTAKSIAEEESGKGKALKSLSLRPGAQEGDGSLELFRYSPGEPFTANRGWLAWGLIGVVLSPLVVGSVATLISSLGYEEAVGGRGTVDGVAGMIETGPATYLSLLTVTGVLAPILEETLFRGFLLTSLSSFMPAWAAVIASSSAFGLAHFSLRDLPVLFALGVLLGFSYVRSRNLLTPIIIHGTWNSAVLSLLFVLSASGVDVQQLLNEMRG